MKTTNKSKAANIRTILEEEEEMGTDCCDCQGFFKFPQGWDSGRAVLLAFLSMILVLAGMGSCNFVSITNHAWGLLWRQTTPEEALINERLVGCITFNNVQKSLFDAPWKTGSAFAYLSIIIVVVTAPATFSLVCVTMNPYWLGVLGSAFLAASATQILAFVIFASHLCTNKEQFQCRLSFGAGVTVGAIVFCLVSAFSLFFLRSQVLLAVKKRQAAESRSNQNDGAEDGGSGAEQQDADTEEPKEGEESRLDEETFIHHSDAGSQDEVAATPMEDDNMRTNSFDEDVDSVQGVQQQQQQQENEREVQQQDDPEEADGAAVMLQTASHDPEQQETMIEVPLDENTTDNNSMLKEEQEIEFSKGSSNAKEL